MGRKRNIGRRSPTRSMLMCGPVPGFTIFVQLDMFVPNDSLQRLAESLIIELCKSYTWQLSCNVGESRQDGHSAQVAPLHNVEKELVMGDHIKEYNTVVESYGSLVSFLLRIPQEYVSMHSSPFTLWSVQVILSAHYQQEAKYGFLPRIDTNALKHNFVIVIFPPTTSSSSSSAANCLLEPSMGTVTRQLDGSSSSSICGAVTQKASDDSLTSINAGICSDALSREIEKLFETLSSTKHLKEKRRTVVNKIFGMLRYAYPQAKLKVQMFGSAANNLDFGDSDLDLCIVVPEQQFSQDISRINKLSRERNSYYNMFDLREKLRRSGMENVEAIAHASVPICKFFDPKTGIHCDITTQNTLGVHNSKLVKEYTQLDPRVRPFIYAIKYFSKVRQINSPRDGTLSSYAYTMMALFYLMTCNPPVIPNLQRISGRNTCQYRDCRMKRIGEQHFLYKRNPVICNVGFHTCISLTNDPTAPALETKLGYRTLWYCRNQMSVGELVTGFFEYYAHKFKYDTKITSIRAGRLLQRSKMYQTSYIVVEDPFIVDRNVAHTCSKVGFETILAEFERACTLLKNNSSFDLVATPVDRDPKPLVSSSLQQQNRKSNRSSLRQTEWEAAARKFNEEVINGFDVHSVDSANWFDDVVFEKNQSDPDVATADVTIKHPDGSSTRGNKGYQREKVQETGQIVEESQQKPEQKKSDEPVLMLGPITGEEASSSEKIGKTCTVDGSSKEVADISSQLSCADDDGEYDEHENRTKFVCFQNISEIVDKLDIVEVLSRYGRISQIRIRTRAPAAGFGSATWIVKLLLHRKISELPRSLELSGNRVYQIPSIATDASICYA